MQLQPRGLFEVAKGAYSFNRRTDGRACTFYHGQWLHRLSE